MPGTMHHSGILKSPRSVGLPFIVYSYLQPEIAPKSLMSSNRVFSGQAVEWDSVETPRGWSWGKNGTGVIGRKPRVGSADMGGGTR